MNLSIGLVVVGLPFVLLSLPAFVLFVALPAILLLALVVPLAVIGALLIGPPFLLTRWIRRRALRTPALRGPTRPIAAVMSPPGVVRYGSLDVVLRPQAATPPSGPNGCTLWDAAWRESQAAACVEHL